MNSEFLSVLLPLTAAVTVPVLAKVDIDNHDGLVEPHSPKILHWGCSHTGTHIFLKKTDDMVLKAHD